MRSANAVFGLRTLTFCQRTLMCGLQTLCLFSLCLHSVCERCVWSASLLTVVAQECTPTSHPQLDRICSAFYLHYILTTPIDFPCCFLQDLCSVMVFPHRFRIISALSRSSAQLPMHLRSLFTLFPLHLRSLSALFSLLTSTSPFFEGL